MSVAKLSTTGTLDSMKSGDGNESLDSFIRQTIGKEPLLSFSRTGDSPVQWIQLLQALDQQELPGWPLLTPLKVQMQKCEKCSWEFCSTVNYRRHIRVHRRSLNVNKESHKIRDMLAAFWDKLSLEEAKEVASFKDLMLKEVPGSSVIKALASSIRKPVVWTLPQFYVNAGSTLLEIIHTKQSRLPISSQELFSILDDASERTFLCAGTAESVQKYVFDGEAGKVALELKNLVASTSFLFEQILVKAWLADKDAEALRCQKLLVEEEEAAQKRQLELLERKKQKKLRQKEQKTREQSNGEKAVLDIAAHSTEGSFLAETYSPPASSDSNSDSPDIMTGAAYLEPVQFASNEENDDIDAQAEFNSECLYSGSGQNAETPVFSVNSRRQWQVPKSRGVGRNGFHGNHNYQVLKLEPAHKNAALKDRGTTVNSSKVWTKKFKIENDEKSLRLGMEKAINLKDENKSELIIGSISVPIRNCILRKKNLSLVEQGKHKKSNVLEESANSDTLQVGVNRATAKHWRPVSQHEKSSLFPVQRCNQDFEKGIVLEKLDGRTATDGDCLQSSALDYDDDDDDDSRKSKECPHSVNGGGTLPLGSKFSSSDVKAFLAQRWKEAVSADHVKLVLSPEPDPPGGAHTVDDSSAVAALAWESGENLIHSDERQLSIAGLSSFNED